MWSFETYSNINFKLYISVIGTNNNEATYYFKARGNTYKVDLKNR